MPKLNAEETYKKWATRLSNATEDVKSGVMRVTESPMVKAAASEDKWFQGLQKAKSSGKFKRGLLGVSLDDWKDKTANVGADRIIAGVSAAEGKSVNFYKKLLPFEEKVQNEIKGMANVTLADSVARATKWITRMAEFDKTK